MLSIETYKTFFTGGRPPGKFDGKPMRPGVDVQRHRCQVLHSGVYVCLASVAGMAAVFDTEAWLSPSMISLVVLTRGRDDDLGPRRTQSIRARTRRTA